MLLIQSGDLIVVTMQPLDRKDGSAVWNIYTTPWGFAHRMIARNIIAWLHELISRPVKLYGATTDMYNNEGHLSGGHFQDTVSSVEPRCRCIGSASSNTPYGPLALMPPLVIVSVGHWFYEHEPQACLAISSDPTQIRLKVLRPTCSTDTLWRHRG
jgi:hypothetical protein